MPLRQQQAAGADRSADQSSVCRICDRRALPGRVTLVHAGTDRDRREPVAQPFTEKEIADFLAQLDEFRRTLSARPQHPWPVEPRRVVRAIRRSTTVT